MKCSKLCSRKSPSILTDTSPDSLVSLNDGQIVNELEERAPTLHRCLAAAASSNFKQKIWQDSSLKQLGQKITSTLSMASSVLLRCRNPAMSVNVYRLFVLLWHGGAQRQVKHCCTCISVLVLILFISFHFDVHESSKITVAQKKGL